VKCLSLRRSLSPQHNSISKKKILQNNDGNEEGFFADLDIRGGELIFLIKNT
jgi:hypothetical protein